MSGTEGAAAAVAVACVPDMISNILERLDLVSLFRCSLVCKEWRGLVSDPAFLRRSGIWLQQGGQQSQSSASLIGIFVQRKRPRKISSLFPTTAPVFVPAPGSVLGPQLWFLTSFIRDDDGILDDATPLAARDGLLLVRVWRPQSTDMQNDGGGGSVLMRLCVCNLLTGKSDLLPALDVDATFHANAVHANNSVLGYALLTAADCHSPTGPHDGCCPAAPVDGYTTLFQVLLVGHGHAMEEQLKVLRFTSASGAWDTLDCSKLNLEFRSEPRRWIWGPCGCRVAAVARGQAHWLFSWRRRVTIDVSASTGRASMTAIPVDALAAMNQAVRYYKPHWLCTTAEERLALLCMETNNRLVMMRQRDDYGDHHWDSNHVAEVHVDVELGFGRESLSIVCFGDRSGTALARSRTDPERRAYVLDIDFQSSAVLATKVEGWTRNFDYKTAAPFEIDWAMFFLSRLGVRQQAL